MIDKEDLNKELKLFIPSLKKLDGNDFPPRTLKEVVALIQHYFNHTLRRKLSIFNDFEFTESREVLDAQMKYLARQGNVKPKRRAEIITRDMEDHLWNNGVLGSDSPKKLLETLIYLLGLHLGLRACSEHKALEFDKQITLVTANGVEYLQYVETVSKNKSFGLRQSNLEPKVVKVMCNKDNVDRCVVNIYKKYVSHR